MKLKDKGVEVVGISGDSAQTQKLYKEHNKLPFTLLADENGAVARKFGVPLRPGGKFEVKDLNYTAQRGVTAMRWTFVIGRDGKILYKNDKVKASEDARQVLGMLDK